jgi:hypothetical protein
MKKKIEEAIAIRDKLKIQVERGDLNSTFTRGTVTHCCTMEDSIGCWGWIELNEETSIGFKVFGEKGLRLLETMRGGSSRRVILWGELTGKPAEILVEYWMIS